jgi:hypothetical protein
MDYLFFYGPSKRTAGKKDDAKSFDSTPPERESLELLHCSSACTYFHGRRWNLCPRTPFLKFHLFLSKCLFYKQGDLSELGKKIFRLEQTKSQAGLGNSLRTQRKHLDTGAVEKTIGILQFLFIFTFLVWFG